MEKYKRTVFKKINYEVELTDSFLKNQKEILKNYCDSFYDVKNLDEYISILIESIERNSYGSEKANENTMLEGFGRVWVKSDFWDKIYKPTKEGWKEVKEGELPECGIIITVDVNSEGFFITTKEELENESWDGRPLAICVI